MLDERLTEIQSGLSSLYEQRKTNPSPGLSEAIKLQESRLENFKTSRDFWYHMYSVYPNYDR